MSADRVYGTNISLPPLADLFSTQEDRDDANLEKVQLISLDELHPFPNHPFQVRDDDEMEKLSESIKDHGVLLPAIVRSRKEGGYELISGHRRKHACELAKLTEMPVLVRDMDDDAAILLMVDSNVQREHILPSERAKAYKMKLEALKRQGERSDLTSTQVVQKLSVDKVAEEADTSRGTIQRYLCVEKIDAETGKAVRLANTAFQLFAIHADGTETPVEMQDPFSGDPGQKTSIFKTDSEGRMKTPEKLPLGKYRIVEVEGPNGFYNDSEFNVVFTLSGDSVWETSGDAFVIRQRYANHETLGQITIRKTGEVLSAQKQKGLFGQSKPATLLYESRPLAGAEFTITAAEDIYTQDRQVDENGNRTLWYAKGDVVAVVTTGDGTHYQGVFAPTRTVPTYPFGRVTHTSEEGAVSVVLPLGSYQIRETKAPYGYLPSDKTFDVTLSWDNQEQSILPEQSVEVQNVREKAKVGVYKKDAVTGKFVAGAVFHLYTKDDIYSADGEKLFAAGDLVATSPETNADGYTFFDADIPLREERYEEPGQHNSGRYTIVEIQAPEGYLLNPAPMDVTFTYTGQVVQVLDSTCENLPTKVLLSKRELTGDAELPGATLQLTNQHGEMIREWVSGKTAEKISGLHLDEIYTLTETIPAPGYALAESIRFKLAQAVDSEGNPIPGTDVYVQTGKDLGIFDRWEKVTDATVVMRDDITRVQISKQDITNNRELPGAHLTLKTKDGKVVDEWTSTDKPHYMEKLPAGDYILSEITAPSGYEIAEDVSFTVKPTGEIQTVVMKDRPIPPVPQTGDTSHMAWLLCMAALSIAGMAGIFWYQYRRKQ